MRLFNLDVNIFLDMIQLDSIKKVCTQDAIETWNFFTVTKTELVKSKKAGKKGTSEQEKMVIWKKNFHIYDLGNLCPLEKRKGAAQKLKKLSAKENKISIVLVIFHTFRKHESPFSS